MSETAAPSPGPVARHDDTAGALVRLLVVVVIGVAAAVALHALAVLVVIAALIAMVMLHELGHFATAKWSGMKVTEYFLGFGPRLWSIRRGETSYGVKAIPAGGYVRIVGMTALEEVAPEDEARSYRQASFPRRLLVASAGSVMHFVLAFLLLFAMLVGTGYPEATPANEVTGLAVFASQRSPALAAGIAPGDELVGVDGHAAPIAAIVGAIERSADKKIVLLVRQDGHLRDVAVTPIDGRRVVISTSTGSHAAKTGNAPVGFIGVDLGGSVDVRSNPLVALGRSGHLLGSVTAATFGGIAAVFSLHGLGSFAHQVATATDKQSTTSGSSGAAGNSGQLISIIGAVQIGAAAARQNIAELLYILVAINVFVGVINMVPMLPLDGGHVAIAVYERVRSRRGRRYVADVTKLMPVAYAFLAFMIVIGLGALYVNVLHPVSLPGG